MHSDHQSDHQSERPLPTLEQVTDKSSWHTMLIAQVSALVFAVFGMIAAVFAIKQSDKSTNSTTTNSTKKA